VTGKTPIRVWLAAVGIAAVLLLAGCQQDMAQQPRVKPLSASDFFKDGRGSRPPVPGTVARGQLREDEHLYTGKVGGQLAETFPFAITRADLERGRERYNIYCTPCHGYAGDGRGMIVQRGLKAPPSFHIERLQKSPPGHFFDVTSNGLGAMQDYAAQIAPEDRWRIAAYIRALQLSQNATLADAPAAERQKLEAARPTARGASERKP
jgi:mono/diheme cytochrome c family protein